MRKTLLPSLVCSVVFSLAASTGLAAFDNLGPVVAEKNSLYTGIYIYQNQSIVTLQFGKHANMHIQSQVDMSDLNHHLLEYSKMMFCGLLYQPQPKRILVLGLGGGVIPRQMRQYFPSLQIDIAEIDAEIPPLAARYMGFKEDEKMKVYVDDGRVFIKKQLRQKPVPKYDLIILDAFNGDYIPFHLMTKEFLTEVKGILDPKGVVIANIFSSNRLFDAEFKTFTTVFGRCQVYFGFSSGNAMAVSPGADCPLITSNEAIIRAESLQQTHHFSFDIVEVAEMLDTEAVPAPDAKDLTDDLAPVNWLREQETSGSKSR